MRIDETNVYVGPNVYANFPVIRHRIDIGVLEEWPSKRLGSDFYNGLVEALPGLQEHGCSYGEAGGFIRRLTEDEGTWIGHIWEHVALEIQTIAGSEVSFGKTRSADKYATYDLVFEYGDAEVGLEAARLGRRLLISLMPREVQREVVGMLHDDVDVDVNWDTEREAFIRFAQRYQLGPSTNSLVQAARSRRIPYFRLNDASLIQLGYGVNQRRIQATITGETRHIAVELACDKQDTNKILADMGLPVPKQSYAYSEDEASEAAEYLGFPVVVKPIDANHGRGITVNLRTAEEVQEAFNRAAEEGRDRCVLVEQHIQGDDHRLLVVGGRLVAASKRVPGHIVGDGEHNIRELVGRVNEDPRRGVGHEKMLTRIELDHEARRLLKKKGYTLDSIPDEGEVCFLRATANLSTGGTAADVTDIVHPDNRDMAQRAVKAIGLDVAGVDFLTHDIGRSFREVGGAIVEINAAPGFRMHVSPSEGTPRDVAGPVIDMLYPPGTNSRIPVAAITGTNGKTTTTRMLAHLFQTAGNRVGSTTTDGVYVDGRLVVSGDMTGPVSARMVLRNPDVEVAVLEVARGGLLRSGLGFKWSDVGACLNVSSDHLGLRGVHTLDELADVKSIVVESARDTAVLNADDPRCMEMAERARAEHICLVTMNPDHEEVREHIKAGNRAVVLEAGIAGEMITIFDKGAHIPLLWSHLIPATLEGKARHNVHNAMFASAIGYSMGLTLDDLRHGLRTFTTTFFQTPGRLNVYDEHPFRVILDYAHNPAAVESIVEMSDRLDVEGRRIVVLAAPGDRRNEDIRQLASTVAGSFDTYICREDDDRRGRARGEVAEILRQQIIADGVDPEAIHVVLEEAKAVQEGLDRAESGDLLIIFGDKLQRCWNQIVHHGGEHAFDVDDQVLPADASQFAPDPNASDDVQQSPLPTPEKSVVKNDAEQLDN